MLGRQPAIEVFSHLQLLHWHEVERDSWSITSASFAWVSDTRRREVQQGLNERARRGIVRAAAFDLLDGKQKVEAIGSALRLHGPAWAARHPREMDWLREYGATEEQAQVAAAESLAAELANPIWSVGPKKKGSAS